MYSCLGVVAQHFVYVSIETNLEVVLLFTLLVKFSLLMCNLMYLNT